MTYQQAFMDHISSGGVVSEGKWEMKENSNRFFRPSTDKKRNENESKPAISIQSLQVGKTRINVDEW
jgi:hypothetical protein